MKVSVESTPPQDKPLSSIRISQVGILTAVPEGASARVGHPVVGVAEEVSFPATGTWNPKATCEGFRYRPLLPGERVILEGE